MGRTRISVFSTVVNMAGEETNRVNYRKTTVLGGIISKGKTPLGQYIPEAYIGGPGITYRIFGRWARGKKPPGLLNYNQKVQYQGATIGLDMSGSMSQIVPHVPNPLNGTVEIFSVFSDYGLYTYWADQWMYDNKPNLINTAWTVDYVQATNTITIHFADGTTTSFVPVGNDQNQRYLFVKYRIKLENPDYLFITDPAVTLPTGTDFPDMSAWTLMFENPNTSQAQVSRTTWTVSTFSDNRTPVTGSSNTTYSFVSFTNVFRRYIRSVFSNPPGTDIFIRTHEEMYHNQFWDGGTNIVRSFTDSGPIDIGGGVFRYDRYYVDQAEVRYVRTTQYSHQETGRTEFGPVKLFIYRYGSGNYWLDQILGSPDATESYLPFIPVRVDNKFPSKDYLPDIQKAARGAYRRISRNQSINQIVKKLKKNESLPEIDYAFCVFGVSLNVIENTCKEYLYLFFNKMREQYSARTASLDQWFIDFEAARQSYIAYETWRDAQTVEDHPLKDTPAPAVIPYPPIPEVKIRNYSANPVLGFDYSISWAQIKHEQYEGVYQAGAKRYDGKLEVGPVLSVEELVVYEHWEGARILVPGKRHEITTTYLYYQDKKDHYFKLTLYNLKHRNVVYQGHAVETTATQALQSATESNFIVPLHEQLYRDMRITRSTQMCTASAFLVFNSYKVTKVKWYQTGFFRILIVIVMIVVTMATGVPLAEMSGIFGANGVVGAQLGLVGFQAAVAGAVINAVGGMIVMNIVSNVAVRLLGPELGAIFAAVAMMFIMNPGLADSFGSSLSTGFSELMKVDNILRLTNSVGQGMQAANKVLFADAQKQIAQYTAEARALREGYASMYVDGVVNIDPQMIIESSTNQNTVAFMSEALDNFLARTMMTGSDVAALTDVMITNFAEITLDPEVG